MKGGQVNSIRSMDVRRLWEKLHNQDTREKCYTYYREATFDKPAEISSRLPRSRGFIQRVISKSTEARVVVAIAGILTFGVGMIGLAAWATQSSSADRVDAYLDTLKRDWDQYQGLTRKS